MAGHSCGNTGSPAGPFQMQAYEAADYRNVYARTMELAGYNQLFPEHASFALPAMETGGRDVGSTQAIPGYIPPVLLKAIAWIESGWAQASYDPFVLYGEVGPTLVSHDCGYGIMQVTSGMQNITGVPNLDQAMIGGHFAFNIARGARILADKWNQAPEFRPLVGSRDPYLTEHWYYALWAYNGFAFKNHPLNPTYDPNRPPYSCGPAEDGLGHNRGAYPYPELVMGCAAHPPLRGGALLWDPVDVTLPNRADPAFAGPLAVANWEPCALGQACAPMDLPSPAPAHYDGAVAGVTRDQVLGVPVLAVSHGSVRLIAVPPALPGSATVAVGNPGTGVLAFRATSSASWLKLSAFQGVALGADLGFANGNLTLSADGVGLLPGVYHAQVTLESINSAQSPTVISVTLENGEGTVVQTPNGRAYVMRQGVSRYIPDPATFEASGFSWPSVVAVPDNWINTVPAGQALLSVLADGRLIRPPEAGSPVYVMHGGQRRYVVSPDVFFSCGFGLDAISTLSSATIASVPEGPALSGAPCPRLALPGGTLLHDAAGRVWVVFGGARRWVGGPYPFADCGYRWGNVNSLADSYIAQFPPGLNIGACSRDGSLLWTEDGVVHVVQGGITRRVPDPPTFEVNGYDGAQITPVTTGAFAAGDPLLSVLANGRLFAPPGDAVPIFVMESGAKRHITSPDALAACGYRMDAVVRLSVATIDSLAYGPQLTGAPCTQLAVPPGTMLRGPDGSVWVTFGLVRRWVLSPAAFGSCGYHQGNLNSVPFGILAQLAVGENVTTCSADGSVLWGPSGKVYLVGAGWKRHAPSPATLEAYGHTLGELVPAPEGWLPTGRPLLDVIATGRVIRPPGNSVPVYVMHGGVKRHVISPAVFAGCGYGWDALTILSPATMASLPDGPPLLGQPCPSVSFSDGTLLVGPEGKVWAVQGGQRRWVLDPATFAACGYVSVNLDRVPSSLISALPQGVNLTAPPCP